MLPLSFSLLKKIKIKIKIKIKNRSLLLSSQLWTPNPTYISISHSIQNPKLKIKKSQANRGSFRLELKLRRQIENVSPNSLYRNPNFLTRLCYFGGLGMGRQLCCCLFRFFSC
jgi:hypothetical protein